ncbi:hypothetical protein KEJ32_00550 [Candidatus Bathyarchaeota archaeon]|nr:hypothetical protein [Candidatus Bathyarchaeota archaeon]
MDQLRVFEEAELNDLHVLGFYHSHPFWDSLWSEVDEGNSKLWVGYSFLMVSLATRNVNSYVRGSKGAERRW